MESALCRVISPHPGWETRTSLQQNIGKLWKRLAGRFQTIMMIMVMNGEFEHLSVSGWWSQVNSPPCEWHLTAVRSRSNWRRNHSSQRVKSSNVGAITQTDCQRFILQYLDVYLLELTYSIANSKQVVISKGQLSWYPASWLSPSKQLQLFWGGRSHSNTNNKNK